MTVTVDAATENVRTLTTSPQTFAHAGAVSGVKGVVLALVHGVSSTDHVTAASYGGVAMSRPQRNVDTATEPGAAELWFLGTGVPQGTQTVSYTPGSTTDDFHAVAITLLGADDLEVVAQDGISENVLNPSVTLPYGGRTCMAFAALYGGGAAPSSFTPNANCETVHDHDLGAFYSEIIRQIMAGSANFAIGGTAANDDVAFAAIAVSEVQAAQIIPVGQGVETDLAQATGRLKTQAIVQATETDLAQAIMVHKTLGIGQLLETDSAQAITRAASGQTIAVAQVIEINSAFANISSKVKVIGQTLEINSAQITAWAPKHRLINQVFEMDLARQITPFMPAAGGATPSFYDMSSFI